MGMTIEEAISHLYTYSSTMGSGQTTQEQHEDSKRVAIETMRKYQQLEDFARWVATEVIDEEMWAYNYLAFTELACRKLVQLGIMQESDGEYLYEEGEENGIHET